MSLIQPRLGVHLTNHVTATDAVELAVLAEQEHLDSVWISEDLYYRGAVPIAAAVAAMTTSIEIGFGVLTPYSRHTSLLAMDLMALLDIAGPRVIAGVGAGVEARTNAMVATYANPLIAVREVVSGLRGLLGGEAVSQDGVLSRMHNLQLSFSDGSPAPPLFVAAVGPQALRQAGRIADGVVLTLMSSRGYAAWATAQVGEGMQQAGRVGTLPAIGYFPFALMDDGDEAVRSLKPLLGSYLARWAPIEKLAELLTNWGPMSRQDLATIATGLASGQPAEDVISDALVLEFCIAGDEAACRTQLEQLRACGVTDVIIDPSGSLEEKRASVTALARLRSPALAAGPRPA